MLERILILARDEAERLLGDGSAFTGLAPEGDAGAPWALISIVGWTRKGPAVLFGAEAPDRHSRNGCVGSLQCCFGDILPVAAADAAAIPSHYLFSGQEAARIIAFLETVKADARALILHCDGGVSRSGAVGLFACRWLGLDEAEFFAENRRISPNPWVLQVLLESAGRPCKDLAYWYQLREEERRRI